MLVGIILIPRTVGNMRFERRYRRGSRSVSTTSTMAFAVNGSPASGEDRKRRAGETYGFYLSFHGAIRQGAEFSIMSRVSSPTPEAVSVARTATQAPWRVVVLNDPVNLMSYVVMVFRKVFGFSAEKARKHMLEVHESGRSVLWTGGREQAEGYVHRLQGWQLNAILEKAPE